LAAGLYVENGLFIYLFLITGLFIVAYLARKFSWAVEYSRQQSTQLEQLEQLGQAIIKSPLDGSELTHLLREYVPKMFPARRLAIYINNQILFMHPDDWSFNNQSQWDYILELRQTKGFLANDDLPWIDDQPHNNAIIVAPISENVSSKTIGGIYVELRTLTQQWNEKSLQNFFPAIQTLAGQISSSLTQTETYLQTLQYQNINQELILAGRIQSSFLPRELPNIEGWQIAVTLLPARETSGDFFDVIPLPNGKIGLLIADVMDKGVGPALYMALSRTLIRTYALEFDTDPEVVFFAANQRLLNDARANLFVTALYGILDPKTGDFIYSNAGHNPPFLINHHSIGNYRELRRTGIAMGIEIDSTWDQESVQITPGDVLLFYTDGLPDAQNSDGEFFDEERLIEIATSHLDYAADQLEKLILEQMQFFVGDIPQFDDITLMILKREK
jgi:serine phosphatase RsbU (regulator of sigma subunit)